MHKYLNLELKLIYQITIDDLRTKFYLSHWSIWPLQGLQKTDFGPRTNVVDDPWCKPFKKTFKNLVSYSQCEVKLYFQSSSGDIQLMSTSAPHADQTMFTDFFNKQLHSFLFFKSYIANSETICREKCENRFRHQMSLNRVNNLFLFLETWVFISVCFRTWGKTLHISFQDRK